MQLMDYDRTSYVTEGTRKYLRTRDVSTVLSLQSYPCGSVIWINLTWWYLSMECWT